MLSVCIPVYNEFSVSLIKNLSKQSEFDPRIEIIVFDDASSIDLSKKYEQISDLNNLIIIKSEKNLGRSGSRNKLAQIAKNDFLLFIDGDSETKNDDFISNYYNIIKPGIVACGSTIYKEDPPSKKHILRWKYGHLKENIPPEKRISSKSLHFTTHHFLIDKKVFNKIKFSTEIKGYGHEDSLFGYELRKKNIPVIYIENPLYHIGIESSADFILKSEKAVDNLIFLYLKHSEEKDFIKSIKLLDFYQKQKKYRSIFLWVAVFKLFKNLMKKNLLCNNPSIKVFNIYKFGYFVTNLNKHKNEKK